MSDSVDTTGLVADDEFKSIPTCPVEGCGIDVDLILQSSDSQRFGTHKLNLHRYGDGFPQAESVATGNMMDDIPVLTENGAVLRLMLQFMHHAPQPDLNDIPFYQVAQLAEAVEKYFIYSAIGVCKMFMELNVETYPLDILAYSCKHGYEHISNKVAPFTVGIDTSAVLTKLVDSHFVLKWFRYREHWIVRLRSLITQVPAITLHKGGFEDCGLWQPFQTTLQGRLSVGFNPRMPALFESVFREQETTVTGCTYCRRRAETWRLTAATDFARIPKFSDA